ncbi:hypothetical protein [Streptomyces sp. URMC 129]|uniref:hypothetical protein n=1 Tax=Streptomyces sp. URMC 129 TaxID=3423407 RepID=UPI003F1AE935
MLPRSWVAQVRPAGIIVCPLGWGNARLVVRGDGVAEGRFLTGGSCFMGVREEGGTGSIPYPGEPSSPACTKSTVDPAVLSDPDVAFVLSLALPETAHALELDESGRMTGCRLWARDGSSAYLDRGRVAQAGPRRLWDTVEKALAWFESNACPPRDRFGVTVTPDAQHFWLDEPARLVPQN